MSFAAYAKHGWVLCAIPPGSKGPRDKGWQKRENGITDPNFARTLPGAGILHAYSKTCAIDLDDHERSRTYLLERGINLDELLLSADSVQISSGRANRGKLLYRLDAPLASLKLAPYEVPDPLDPTKRKKYHAFEFRCASAEGLTVQDVLPETIHPVTCKPYEWKYGDELLGHWSNLPPLPEALHKLWLAELQPTVNLGPQAPLGAEISEIDKLLAQRNPDCDYDEWFKTGMAVHHESGGSDDGFRAWDEWSAKGSKYPGREALREKWRSFRSDAANPVTLGSLRSESVAELADFPAAPEFVPGTDTPGRDATADEVMQKVVGDNVVYARNLDLYFDTRDRILYPSDRAVRNAFCPQIPWFERDGGKKGKEFYKIDPVTWLQGSKERRKRDVWGLAMHPGAEAVFEERGRRYANTFTFGERRCSANPAVEALRPKPHELEVLNFLWSRMLSPIYQTWLRKFFAHALQKPGIKIRSAPVLISQETGTGKSTLMAAIPRVLFGPVEELTEAEIRRGWNDNLLGTWWATIEEIYAGVTKAERNAFANRVKPWVSNDDMAINKRGATPFTIVNRTQFTASSNHLDALQLEDDNERRWGVCGVREEKLTEGEVAAIYSDLLKTDRAAGVLKYVFLNESITGFNPDGKPPLTHAKTLMVSAALGSWESAVLERMAAGEAPFHRDIFLLRDVIDNVSGVSNLTPHKIAPMLRAKPFNCRMIHSGHRSTRMWSWRNHEAWARVSEEDRLRYLETGEKPAGTFSDELPNAIATLRAEADTEDPNSDIL